jgi:8-oxo-dGTP diphosphatase
MPKTTAMTSSNATFCQRCGHEMGEAEISGRMRLFCAHCGFILYQNPVPGVGVLIEMGDGIVLIRRGHAPHRGRWALPSGFIEADESIEDAALRECKEETGLEVELLELFGVDSFPEGPVQSGIIVFYRARPIAGELAPGDDAAQAAVFPPDALPADLAFRTHRTVLTRWAGLRGSMTPFAPLTDDSQRLALDLLIRRARADDEPVVLSLLPFIPANASMTAEERLAAKVRLRESTNLEVLVADSGNGVVGFVVLSFVSTLTGLRAWIGDVVVDPTHRRKGIGRALVEAAIQRASRRGATHLFMDTSRGNPDVQEFYAACGFERGGVEPLHIR